MKFPYTASEVAISVFVNGRMHSIAATHPGFASISEHLKGEDHDAAFIEEHANPANMISRLTEGAVTVIGSTVYYKGERVHTTLTLKLLDLLDAGFDATPWAKFLDNVSRNPSENSKRQLYDFLESHNAPITPDGHFVVFKRVRYDYTDVRTGQFDNTPGQIVSMPREQVVDDPTRTCSAGLHVCAISYLNNAYVSGSAYRTVACKVNPMNVVSVPVDYKFAKIRACEYEVIGDVDEEGSLTEDVVSNSVLIDTNPTPEPEVEDTPSDEPDYAPSQKECVDMQTRTGNKCTMSEAHFIAEVKRLGQRGFDREYGVARTTVQDTLRRIGS